MKTQEELVKSYSDSMLHELIANKHKGDWRKWSNVSEMSSELDYHIFKLEGQILSGGENNKEKIKEYLADCGNILLMIGNSYDLY